MGKFRSALVEFNETLSDGAITANAATVARLTTPTIESTPKADLLSKVKYALSIIPENAVVSLQRATGQLYVSANAGVKSALVSAFTTDTAVIATITASADDISADGLRSKFTLTGGTASPTPATGLSTLKQAIDDLVAPRRPSISFDQLFNALSEIYGELVNIELVQATGVVRVGVRTGTVEMFTALADQDGANNTVALEITEEDVAESDPEATPQFGG